jgi:hypothetical protein
MPRLRLLLYRPAVRVRVQDPARAGTSRQRPRPTPTHKPSASLSSKFGRFVETVLSSPAASTSGSSSGGGDSVGPGRIHRGWVDLVPEQLGSSTQPRNPFIVDPQSTQTSQAPPIMRRSTPSATVAMAIPEEGSPSAAPSSSTGGPSDVLAASFPYTKPQKLPFMATRVTPSTPPSLSRRTSSSANSVFNSSETTDRQVFVPASSPSLRSTWTHKTRPRANTTNSITSPAPPKWSWTASLGKGFGTPTVGAGGKGKSREPIDSGWGEPDELSPDGERRRGGVEDEGFWDGLEAKKRFGAYRSRRHDRTHALTPSPSSSRHHRVSPHRDRTLHLPLPSGPNPRCLLSSQPNMERPRV